MSIQRKTPFKICRGLALADLGTPDFWPTNSCNSEVVTHPETGVEAVVLTARRRTGAKGRESSATNGDEAESGKAPTGESRKPEAESADVVCAAGNGDEVLGCVGGEVCAGEDSVRDRFELVLWLLIVSDYEIVCR